MNAVPNSLCQKWTCTVGTVIMSHNSAAVTIYRFLELGLGLGSD